MTTTAINPKREAVMKQREKERLERLLALLFGYRYPLHWTLQDTSYFDGKACYVKYDVQTPQHRLFALSEERAIRQHHAFHERGHEYFDCLDDYREWIMEMSSSDYKEWEDNAKHPLKWVRFFGITAMDGRMEFLVTSLFPTQQDFFDFGNYEWRFGIRGEKAGEDIGQDFQECFMHRVLGMEDIEEWDVEAVNLVDVVQDDIDRLRTAATTLDCLEITTEIIKVVWPQLWEWMDIQEPEEMVILIPGTPIDDHDIEEASWSSREEAKERSERAFKKAGITPTRSSVEKDETENNEDASNNSDTSETTSDSSNTDSEHENETDAPESPEESSEGDSSPSESDSDPDEENDGAGPSKENDDQGDESDSSRSPSEEDSETNEGENTSVDENAGTEQSSDNNNEGENNTNSEAPSREEKLQQLIATIEQQMEKEQQEIDAQEEPFETRKEKVEIQDKQTNLSDTVTITEYPRTDLPKYYEVKTIVNPQIGPVGRAMKEILKPIPDKHRKNQKKGKLRVDQTWRAQKCNDMNIYDRKIKGKPAKDSVVITQFDNSGSTWGDVVQQMQKAAVLITEGCEKAKVPHYSYAFTEEGRESLIYPLKPTDQFTNREKGYIGGMTHLMGNRDTLVLQWTVDQIAKRPEEIKLLIMISDGLPIFEAGVEDETTMRKIVLKAEKKGIDVLCLFVGDHDPRTVEMVRYMYNNHVISIESNIARELSKQVKRIIKKRRA